MSIESLVNDLQDSRSRYDLFNPAAATPALKIELQRTQEFGGRER